jgi:hypothetical protein
MHAEALVYQAVVDMTHTPVLGGHQAELGLE